MTRANRPLQLSVEVVRHTVSAGHHSLFTLCRAAEEGVGDVVGVAILAASQDLQAGHGARVTAPSRWSSPSGGCSPAGNRSHSAGNHDFQDRDQDITSKTRFRTVGVRAG